MSTHPVTPRGTPTDRSGTIATNATAQVLAVANRDRRFLIIVNLSDEDMWVSFTGTAAPNAAGSFPLAAKVSPSPSGGIFCSDAGFVPSGAISIYGTTAGKRFFAQEA